MEDPPKRIGVFGGSFDPIHTGHIHAAKQAAEFYDLDLVIFIPAGISPHKLDTTPATFANRAEMVEIAIRNEENFSCDKREGQRTGPSYTVDTLRELKKENPEARLYLILGTDQLRAFDRWQSPDEIRQLATLIIIERPDHAVSSTKIRNLLEKGDQNLSGLVHEDVLTYIKAHSLYQASCPS